MEKKWRQRSEIHINDYIQKNNSGGNLEVFFNQDVQIPSTLGFKVSASRSGGFSAIFTSHFLILTCPTLGSLWPHSTPISAPLAPALLHQLPAIRVCQDTFSLSVFLSIKKSKTLVITLLTNRREFVP